VASKSNPVPGHPDPCRRRCGNDGGVTVLDMTSLVMAAMFTVAVMVPAMFAVMRPAGGRQRDEGSHERKQRHHSHGFHLAKLDCALRKSIL
jgi:hypothetical protein